MNLNETEGGDDATKTLCESQHQPIHLQKRKKLSEGMSRAIEEREEIG